MSHLFTRLTLVSIVLTLATHRSNAQEVTIPEGWFQKDHIKGQLKRGLGAVVVNVTEVDWYPMIEGEVETLTYQSWRKDLEALQPHYDAYLEGKKQDSIRAYQFQEIDRLIGEYLKGKNKTLLIEAQALADSQQLKIEVEDSSPQYRGYANKPQIELRLAEKGRVSSRKEIQLYQSQLEKQKPQERVTNYQAKEYLRLMEQQASIPKTEKGKVQSKVAQKRLAYLPTTKKIELGTISGTFELIGNDFSYTQEEIPGVAQAKELYPAQETGSIPACCTIIKDTESGQLITINSTEVFQLMERDMNQAAYVEEVEALGYQTHTRDWEVYLNTNHYEVKVDRFLMEALKENPKVLQTLDAHYGHLKAVWNQLPSITSALTESIRVYRIKKQNISNSMIEKWKAETKKAIKLNDQLMTLNMKEFPLSQYYPLDASQSQEIDTFTDALIASRGILML
ncbi:hypothetical protein GCM10009117_08990 [Gangjinia marincola]|uniref:Uncharacterized protein n=1 Tax=Gangjinia marincola TaxID=578463 RepID=A0ABP3XQY1_9FLAO